MILTADDVLVAYVLSPEYVAVTESVPAGSAVVVNCATPAFTFACPSVVVPAVNVTVPVAALGETVAVSVTEEPAWMSVDEAVRVVVVAVSVAFTTTVTAFEVLLLYVLSPPYTATIESVPSVSDVVVYVATPPARVAVPRLVEFA